MSKTYRERERERKRMREKKQKDLVLYPSMKNIRTHEKNVSES